MCLGWGVRWGCEGLFVILVDWWKIELIWFDMLGIEFKGDLIICVFDWLVCWKCLNRWFVVGFEKVVKEYIVMVESN